MELILPDKLCFSKRGLYQTKWYKPQHIDMIRYDILEFDVNPDTWQYAY